jgi:hypothetical protein
MYSERSLSRVVLTSALINFSRSSHRVTPAEFLEAKFLSTSVR